jgi:hypothetical protein
MKRACGPPPAQRKIRVMRNITPPVLLAALLLAACATTPQTPGASDTRSAITDAPVDADGLRRIQVAGLQEVYARPGANLGSYDKILLDPIEVSFRRNWDPKPGGWPIGADEKQQIRDGLARIVREEVTRELSRSGRYQIVATPGDDVLRIDAEIRDLVINAPDSSRAGPTRTYTLSAGEMTLVAELRDSPTNDLIARVVDRKRDPEQAWFELTTRVDNVAAARRAATDWAIILRRQLDAAHELRGTPPR